MGTVKCFEDLEIWQLAREFCKDIFRFSCEGDFSKDFSLRNQISASSGSIMDNIAEGFERSGNKEFIQFLYIAKGSCGEARSQLYRTLDFGYISDDVFNTLSAKAKQISQSIAKLIKYLKQSNYKGIKYANEQ
ncbi:MAG: four helix bundle protein [Tannerella sp.]|jgi:four helix bundle protein|nr:four helix bundle protein [Tannerella sp.]